MYKSPPPQPQIGQATLTETANNKIAAIHNFFI
jgi:hypothetical protein